MPKKLLSLTLALLLLLGICLPAASVSAASSPTLSQTMLAIRPGESATLTVNLNGSGATVSSWSSSNPSVATVSNGRVQGVSYGISAVTAYFSNGTYATCQVHVALQGIDVSYYQGNINWSAVASSRNVDFAIIRTGYGGENWAEQVDTCFEQNYAGATGNNIPVGVYHFSYATDVEMAKREAQFCLSILDGRPLDYPVFYDIETAQHRNMSSSQLAAIVTAFCDIIEAAGYTPAIYSSPTFFNGSLSSRCWTNTTTGWHITVWIARTIRSRLSCGRTDSAPFPVFPATWTQTTATRITPPAVPAAMWEQAAMAATR